MKSIVMCCVVLICATTVHGTDYIRESELNIIMYNINCYIEKYNEIVNQANDKINYEVFSQGSQLGSELVAKTVDTIMLQTLAAVKRGVNKTHCYEAAKLNAAISRERARDAMALCTEEYKKIFEAYVTEQIELLKTLYIKFSTFKNGIDRTRPSALIAKYIKSRKNFITVKFQNALTNSTELDSCLRKSTPSLTADLQNVQSDASACISAS